MTKTSWMLLVMGSLAIVAAACSPSAPTFQEEFEGVTGVVLNSTEGNVTINGQDRTTAEVIAEASFSDSEQFDIHIEDGLLFIEHDCGDASRCSVDYTLNVPAGTGLEITTVDADVTVSDVKAFVAVTTTTGSTFVRRIEGDIVVGTTSGQITGTQNKSAKASFTASGESKVSVSFDSPIDQLRVENDRGDITAQLTGGPYNLTVEQASGSLDVKIDTSESSSMNVAIRTQRGDIQLFQN